MENNLKDRQQSSDNIYQTIINIESKYDKTETTEFTLGMTVEDGKNFFRYLRTYNLSKDPELLILPPNNHYYFDEKELSHVRTLINLKNLNLIKDLDSFLFTLARLLPNDSNFLGYFSYNKFSFTGDSLMGLYTRFNNFLDFRTDHNLDEKELSHRLQKHGFRVIDMTEMNGITFFYSRKPFHYSKLSA